VDKRTEFPALEARKSDLEQQHREARQQVNDAMRAGQPDNGKMQWLSSIREELDELSYVLRVMYAEIKIDVPSRYTLAGGIVFIVITVAQIWLLWWIGAGH
jgi:hypothetical protein